MSDSSASEDRIRDAAYRLWEEAGRPHGRDAEFWHEARALVGRESVEHEPVDHEPADQETVDHEAPVPAEAAASAAKSSKKAAKPNAAVALSSRRARKTGAQLTTPSA